MSQATMTVETCPRDKKSLGKLKRTIMYRLLFALGALEDEEVEVALMQASNEDQVDALYAALKKYDEQGGSG